MATFVLIHGAWHGGWCWRDVVAHLRGAGHHVFAPTLSGVGERAQLAPHVDLSTHIDEVARALTFEDLDEVVLVGHSYAGLVISGAAAIVPERVERLVFLDAFIASPGQSMFDLLRPERRAVYEAGVAEGCIPSPPPDIFGIADPAQAAWTAERLTPHPLATWAQPLPAASTAPGTYIRCTRGPLVPSFEGFATGFGRRVREIDSGHDAMITRPVELATLLTH